MGFHGRLQEGIPQAGPEGLKRARVARDQVVCDKTTKYCLIKGLGIKGETGSKIPFRGRKWLLTVRRHDGPHVEIAFKNGFVVDLPDWVAAASACSIVASEIKRWVKQRVRRDVQEFANEYGDRFQLKALAIHVAEFIQGWGSCGPKGTINLDWRLVFAPKRVLQCVVVHELAHLKHGSHDAKFWSFLGTIMPDYERPKGWLSANQAALDARFLGPANALPSPVSRPR
jgi:predicted metal-dependent hydrolase